MEALEGLWAMSTSAPQDSQQNKPHKSIEEILAPFWNMSEEEREKLPTDGAAQHDHYIYGWPKRKDI